MSLGLQKATRLIVIAYRIFDRHQNNLLVYIYNIHFSPKQNTYIQQPVHMILKTC